MPKAYNNINITNIVRVSTSFKKDGTVVFNNALLYEFKARISDRINENKNV